MRSVGNDVYILDRAVHKNLCHPTQLERCALGPLLAHPYLRGAKRVDFPQDCFGSICPRFVDSNQAGRLFQQLRCAAQPFRHTSCRLACAESVTLVPKLRISHHGRTRAVADWPLLRAHACYSCWCTAVSTCRLRDIFLIYDREYSWATMGNYVFQRLFLIFLPLLGQVTAH